MARCLGQGARRAWIVGTKKPRNALGVAGLGRLAGNVDCVTRLAQHIPVTENIGAHTIRVIAGAQFIELHTGTFAEHFADEQRREAELQRLIAAAKQAHALGLRVNAGHGLNYENLATLHRVPHLVELNIGHSIVSRALFTGLTQAVKDMLAAMAGYPG